MVSYLPKKIAPGLAGFQGEWKKKKIVNQVMSQINGTEYKTISGVDSVQGRLSVTPVCWVEFMLEESLQLRPSLAT